MYRALAYGLVGVVAVATGESQGIVLQTAALAVDAPVALDAGLQGVALQLKELEAMKERGTLDDMTFAHAVHEATVLNPLVSSLSAMGVLHDKGQLSDEELAFTKSVAFSRFDQTASGNLIVPPVSMGNPSPTGEATFGVVDAIFDGDQILRGDEAVAWQETHGSVSYPFAWRALKWMASRLDMESIDG